MNTRTTVARDILGMVALLGLAAIILRLFFGLGASTALSDAVPWGLWKILNMVAGVALATGGFTLACAVYVFGLERYRSLLRPAILVAFLGYGSSCFALMLDIGLPHRIWHAIIYWNEHSFLFEVAWCVMLYFTVTVIEMSPVILEKFHYKRLVHWLHIITKPVVIVGITLSTLHHSSLGSLFLISPSRLHEIWYTGWLPVLFFVSAVGGGMMFVVLITVMYGWLKERKPDYDVLRRLASFAAIVLAVLFLVKFIDIGRRGVWGAIFSGSFESILFWGEVLLGCVIPVVLMAVPSTRRAPAGVVTASASAASGLLLNRLNVGIFGYFSSADAFYWPSLPEWALSIGIIAAAGLAFVLVADYFSIFGNILGPATPLPCRRNYDGGMARPMWQNLRAHRLSHMTLLPVVVIPAAIIVFWNDASSGYPMRVKAVAAPSAIDAMRSKLRIDGNLNGDYVVFDHARHKKDFGGDDSCQKCHHAYYPADPQTSCHRCHSDMFQPTNIFDHERHALWVGQRLAAGQPKELWSQTAGQTEVTQGYADLEGSGFDASRLQNTSCGQCHPDGQPRSAASATACTTCHGLDMGLKTKESLDEFGAWAMSYKAAMHKQCIHCHEEQAKIRNKPLLAECQTCHQQYKQTSSTMQAD